MGRPTVAIVTGANRGIGEAIVRSLADQPPHIPLIIYAASRKGVDLGLQPSSDVQIRYPTLDIASSTSIQNLFRIVKDEHGVVHGLINNAGVNLDDDYKPENVRKTLDTNVRGTLHMCQTFTRIMSKRGRIVNLSSVASSLGQYSKRIQQQFRSPNMTLEDLEALLQEYQECANQGLESQKGWPQKAYSVSKAAVNALTAVLARESPGIFVNACCPGWVATDMGRMVGPRPFKSAADGAKIPIRLAFKDIGEVSGKYWSNPSVSDVDEGQITNW